MLQSPEQAHEAEGVSASQGTGDVEVVSLRERVGPGHTLHTLEEIFFNMVLSSGYFPYLSWFFCDVYLDLIS